MLTYSMQSCYHTVFLLSDYRGIAKWFGAHYNQGVGFSSAVKCKKGPQVLTALLLERSKMPYFACIFMIRQ